MYCKEFPQSFQTRRVHRRSKEPAAGRSQSRNGLHGPVLQLFMADEPPTGFIPLLPCVIDADGSRVDLFRPPISLFHFEDRIRS